MKELIKVVSISKLTFMSFCWRFFDVAANLRERLFQKMDQVWQVGHGYLMVINRIFFESCLKDFCAVIKINFRDHICELLS